MDASLRAFSGRFAGGLSRWRNLIVPGFFGVLPILSVAIHPDGPIWAVTATVVYASFFPKDGWRKDLRRWVLPALLAAVLLVPFGLVRPFQVPDNSWMDGSAGAYWIAVLGIGLSLASVAFEVVRGVGEVLLGIRDVLLRVAVIADHYRRMRFKRIFGTVIVALVPLTPAILMIPSGLEPGLLDPFHYDPSAPARIVSAFFVGVALVLGTFKGIFAILASKMHPASINKTDIVHTVAE